jgi:four helix bundle protein
MAVIRDFKDLIVWQKSMQLTTNIYSLTREFPKEEIYGLTSQLRRSAVSICANIAEGHSRNTKGEFIQFLGIAKGSLSELETLIILASQFKYIKDDEARILNDLIIELNKMLKVLIKNLKSH